MILVTESESSVEPSTSGGKSSESTVNPTASTSSSKPVICNGTSANSLLGRWRLCVELFGRVFLEDVGSEPSSVLNELGRFDVKETKFRREMERLRNSTQRDLTIEVRDFFKGESKVRGHLSVCQSVSLLVSLSIRQAERQTGILSGSQSVK